MSELAFYKADISNSRCFYYVGTREDLDNLLAGFSSICGLYCKAVKIVWGYETYSENKTNLFIKATGKTKKDKAAISAVVASIETYVVFLGIKTLNAYRFKDDQP